MTIATSILLLFIWPLATPLDALHVDGESGAFARFQPFSWTSQSEGNTTLSLDFKTGFRHNALLLYSDHAARQRMLFVRVTPEARLHVSVAPSAAVNSTPTSVYLGSQLDDARWHTLRFAARSVQVMCFFPL